jgi:hypothetical protein
MELERSAANGLKGCCELNFVLFHVEHLRENNLGGQARFFPDESDIRSRPLSMRSHLRPFHADGCRRCLSIATSRREIAAGVTPEIREACPTDAGFTRLSFSLTSLEKPVIPS